MTIKAKLSINAIIVLVIILMVGSASIVGLTFIKSKLFYLTERSTPFQMRTMEFQRAIQGMTTDLIKVSAARSREEYGQHRTDAEKSLSEVRSSQETLEGLAGGEKIRAYDELKQTAGEIFEVTDQRIRTEADADAASRAITDRLNEASKRMEELDTTISSLLTSRQTALLESMEGSKAVTITTQNLDRLRGTMKDLQIAFSEATRAQDKKALIIGKGKLNTTLAKAQQSEYLKQNEKLNAEMKLLSEKVELLIKVLMGQAEGSKDTVARDVDERLSVVLLSLEQDSALSAERFKDEQDRQVVSYNLANTASDVMQNNAEVVASGLTIRGLSNRLFLLSNMKEVDSVEAEARKIFEKADNKQARLEKLLKRLDAKEEIKKLQIAKGSLDAVKNLLFAKDGVIAKVRQQLAMRTKAAQAIENLRIIVLKQAEEGKKTVSTAQGEQEKAIGTVNKMVRFSTLTIGAISIGSILFGILFGIWVYRSISRPLSQLMKVADEVSNGNLAYIIPKSSSDEIGVVQTSMAKMVGNLKEIVGKITASTSRLASSSEELSATATVIDKGSREQTSQVEQSATAMDEMSQTTLDVAKNASATSDSAVKMKDLAEHGRQAMGVTVTELVKFSETFRQAADKIEAVSRQSQDVSNVVSLIKDIADQTNLLALNAAIEAAHAGDMGRGFAVVADNVRQLAERTAGATEDITKTMQKMQTDVDETVTFVRHEKDAVERVLSQVKGTMEEIGGIVTNVEQVTNMIQRIAVATDQQSSTSDMVSQSMEGITNITRQLNNSIEEIKRSSGDLSMLATELNTMAGWFKT
jgi:methyl-accepting chemotaxis protein